MNKIKIKSIQVTTDIIPLSKYNAQNNDLAKFSIGIVLKDKLVNDTDILIPKSLEDGFKSQYLYDLNGNKVVIGDLDASSQDVETYKTNITSTLPTFYENPQKESLNNLIKNLMDYYEIKISTKKYTLKSGQEYLNLYYTKEILSDGDFRILETTVPVPAFELTNDVHNKASLLITMPLEFGNSPNKISEAKWKPVNGVEKPLHQEFNANSNRYILSEYWQNDPYIYLKYKY